MCGFGVDGLFRSSVGIVSCMNRLKEVSICVEYESHDVDEDKYNNEDMIDKVNWMLI
jgi:hypothetical protein